MSSRPGGRTPVSPRHACMRCSARSFQPHSPQTQRCTPSASVLQARTRRSTCNRVGSSPCCSTQASRWRRSTSTTIAGAASGPARPGLAGLGRLAHPTARACRGPRGSCGSAPASPGCAGRWSGGWRDPALDAGLGGGTVEPAAHRVGADRVVCPALDQVHPTGSRQPPRGEEPRL